MGRPVTEVTVAGVRILVVVIQLIDREKKIESLTGEAKKNLLQQGVMWNFPLLYAQSTVRITESKAVTSEGG